MANRYLTLSEAEKFTGKSRSTLRRYIDTIVKSENSPDRHLLLPTVEEVFLLREQSQPFAWKVSEELLRRQFLTSDETPGSSGEQGINQQAETESSRLVAVLEKSIAILERELSEKNKQISDMSERLREGNILQKDLQQRLALPPATQPEVKDVSVAAEQDAPTEQKESTQPKRRPFSWLFGS